MNKLAIIFKKLVILVLLSMVQISMALVMHNGVLEYYPAKKIHDISWGIGVYYAFYFFIFWIIIHNFVYLFLFNKKYTIYIFAFLLLVILFLFLGISYRPYRAALLMVSTISGMLIPFEMYYFISNKIRRGSKAMHS